MIHLDPCGYALIRPFCAIAHCCLQSGSCIFTAQRPRSQCEGASCPSAAQSRKCPESKTRRILVNRQEHQQNNADRSISYCAHFRLCRNACQTGTDEASDQERLHVRACGGRTRQSMLKSSDETAPRSHGAGRHLKHIDQIATWHWSTTRSQSRKCITAMVHS
ncbi:hypothetical protein T440DRAFT_248426 [Plenodomus tracheiphilus IPT5]|uniref:Uncharacterized protein n=1 Tax=Plenodomus tracheiphilus IPT5 TaxID=1408161 RepID=A0A6A7AVI0_9PLEO|nr:hypothetical protein T440DRAFT_248426 [Plenodomus tracheiphilus IPT5]